MAAESTPLLAKLEQAMPAHRASDYVPIFHGVIDIQASIDLHLDTFTEILKYVEDYILEYAVELPDSTDTWVPLEYIKHICQQDKNFYFRLLRFVKGFTSRNYRIEDDDVILDLGVGNIGNSFLSLDMLIALMLHEHKEKKEKGKAEAKEVPLVKELQADQVETLDDQAEASMALVLLQKGESAEEPNYMLSTEEVEQALPELDLTTLHPIVVDGKEFLFLDDISKSLGIREDEALSILVDATSMQVEGDENKPGLQIDFEDHELTKSLELMAYNAERTLEENIATALVAIQDMAPVYESVPESAFKKHQSFSVSGRADQGGSINIVNESLVECDDNVEV